MLRNRFVHQNSKFCNFHVSWPNPLFTKISAVIAARKLRLGHNLDTTDVYIRKIPNQKSSTRFLEKCWFKGRQNTDRPRPDLGQVTHCSRITLQANRSTSHFNSLKIRAARTLDQFRTEILLRNHFFIKILNLAIFKSRGQTPWTRKSRASSRLRS